MNMRLTMLVLISAILFSSCVTRRMTVPDDLPPSKIIQRAQEASDRNRYRQSLRYYEVILERYPNNVDLVITAEYEIAFIHYKQKKYELSKSEFQTLLERYNKLDAEFLPPKYKILSEKVLVRIEEVQVKTQRRFFWQK